MRSRWGGAVPIGAVIVVGAMTAVVELSCDQAGTTGPQEQSHTYSVSAASLPAASEVGGPASPAPSVRVLVDGRAAVGVRVEWSAENGGAALPTSSTTDSAGLASTSWTLGTSAGAQRLTASLLNGTASVPFSTMATPGPAVRLTLQQKSITLADIGDTVSLRVERADRFGNAVTAPSVTFTSLNGSVASVSAAGLIRGLAAGSARVVAAAGSTADMASIEVRRPMASISASPRTLRLGALGATASLSAVVRDRRGDAIAEAAVTWLTGDSTVAAVSAAGLVTARSNGRTTVFARADTLRDSVSVTVSQVVARVTLSPPTATILPGDTVRLAGAATDSLGSAVVGATLAWRSLDPAIATVSSSGVVTGVSPGTATIRAEAGGVAGDAGITVKAPTQTPAGVRLSIHQATLNYIDAQLQLSASVVDGHGQAIPSLNPQWSSLDPRLATVSSTGLVTQVAGNGYVAIVARFGAFADTAHLSLQQVLGTILFTPSVVRVAVGDSARVTVAAIDSGGHQFPNPGYGTYRSFETDRVMDLVFDATPWVYWVKGKAAGSGSWTFTRDNVSGVLSVTVYDPVQAIARVQLSPHTLTLNWYRETFMLTASALDASGAVVPGARITFTSLDASVADVSSSGMVTQWGIWGTTRIIAAAGGRADTAVVAVRQVPKTLQRPDTLRLKVGDSALVMVPAADSGGTAIYIVSLAWGGNAVGATMRNGGVLVRGLNVGTASIGLGIGSWYVDLEVVVTAAPGPTGLRLDQSGPMPGRHAQGAGRRPAPASANAVAYGGRAPRPPG